MYYFDEKVVILLHNKFLNVISAIVEMAIVNILSNRVSIGIRGSVMDEVKRN